MAFELFKNDIKSKKNKIFIGNFNFKKKYNFKSFLYYFLKYFNRPFTEKIVIE